MARDRKVRHPDIGVVVRSPNPLALIAAVREELRRAGAGASEVERFSDAAMAVAPSAERLRRVCREWVGSAEVAVEP